MDVYLDKFFDTDAKIKKFLLEIELQKNETLEDEGRPHF